MATNKTRKKSQEIEPLEGSESFYCQCFRALSEMRADEFKLRLALRFLTKINDLED
jgi:hypothetical protein